ncbi:MAG: PqqD family protein [Brooklawnia sp.]|jgi:hypothetical protein
MRYRIPPRVAYVVDDTDPDDPTVYLMQPPDGDPLVLTGSGGLIWSLAADGVADVPGAVAEAVGRPVAEILEDVSAFLGEMVGRGLLEPEDARPGTSPV